MRGSGNYSAPGLRIRGEGDYVLIPPSASSSGVSHLYLDPEAAIEVAPRWLLDAVFAGFGQQSSGKILAFPNITVQKASSTDRTPGLSYGKLLPFVTHASCPVDRRHRVYVYMSFQFHCGRWRCQFLEKDLQTLLPRALNLATSEEVIALADRGGGLSHLEGRHALDLAIAARRGGVFLSLTMDQYSQLQMHCRPTSASLNAGRGGSSRSTGLQNTARMFD
jgi:hypothetical protein